MNDGRTALGQLPSEHPPRASDHHRRGVDPDDVATGRYATKQLAQTQTTAEAPITATVDYKLEVAVIPVSDVDRAKDFYAGLGWREDADFQIRDDFRVLQFTPTGSLASVISQMRCSAPSPALPMTSASPAFCAAHSSHWPTKRSFGSPIRPAASTRVSSPTARRRN